VTTLEVQMEPAEWDSLRRHLLKGRHEQVAFAFCEYVENERARTFLVREIWLAEPSDFDVQSDVHITLTDDALARLIKRAWNMQLAVVELHSHPMSNRRVGFSPTDLTGLADHVPYMFWRLRGRPYAAIVVGQAAVDAVAWVKGPDDLQAVGQLRIGAEVITPTRETISQLERTRGKV
jgi:hypothetical protein